MAPGTLFACRWRTYHHSLMQNFTIKLVLIALCFGGNIQQRTPTNPTEQRRYEGFSAYYEGFGIYVLYPVRLEDMPRVSHDVTSCLFQKRREFTKILGRASMSAEYKSKMTRLVLIVDDDQWCVDDSGVVLHKGVSRQLSAQDFRSLKLLMLQELPLNQVTSVE